MEETPTSIPPDAGEQINSLKARVASLEARCASLEAWVAWFQGYLRSHPGGVALLGAPPP